MRFPVLCAVMFFSVSTASAETVVLEYPDHYYVESTGTAGGKSEAAQTNAPAGPALPEVAQQSAPRSAARPFSNVSPIPATTEERRTALMTEIGNLQRERADLLSSLKAPSSDAATHSQQDADAKLRKIKKMQSELLKLPARVGDLR